jgi:ABC-type nickel/cobalt efflux system permease component RcnA
MKLFGTVAAILLSIVGVVWTLQGAGVIGGSFMTGSSRWLYVGIATLIVGLCALWWIFLTRRRGA